MIEIKNLTKAFGSQAIFKNASFTFPDTGLFCLLGASGCGKSTLLNMLAGFDSNYSGSISVCGTQLSSLNSLGLCNYRRNNIGFVFQNYNLLTGYTLTENIMLACNPDSENKRKAAELLKKFGIHSKANEKIENLSGGQKQRVAIIRALMDSPAIILADEPTGSLDRKNSSEIMQLLKEMSHEHLVLVITHDEKICNFADEVVTIESGRLIGHSVSYSESPQKLKTEKPFNTSAFKRGSKNFRVHIRRYIAVSLAISIGVLSFMLSLSSKNIMQRYILDFKQKNTAFNNGYVKADDNADEVLKLLQSDERIENVYRQYVTNEVSLTVKDKTENMDEKYPMPKATESMSYGTMPKPGQNEISISPSLAKKFNNDINKLIGQKLELKFNNKEYNLTITGIFNAEYDDFFVSSDIEQEFYSDSGGKELYSISYDVKSFEDIVSVTKQLSDKNIKSETAAKEVEALQITFQNLNRLFMIVSVLILAIGLFISSVLLFKLQNSRYKELGLLSALGLSKHQIRSMIIYENIFLSLTAAVINAAFIGLFYLISNVFNLGLIITALQLILSVAGTLSAVILIGTLSSQKLIRTEPAAALRK